jgi:hypothetical protein
VSLVRTLGFSYATAPFTHPDGYISLILVRWGFVFCSIGKMMRAFTNEITAGLRCVRVFVKLRSVAYVPICCLPS